MTMLTEDFPWEALEASLEEMFARWRLTHAEQRARSIVGDMRRSGWRIPLPEGQRPPDVGRPLAPERVRVGMDRCRQALREAQERREEDRD